MSDTYMDWFGEPELLRSAREHMLTDSHQHTGGFFPNALAHPTKSPENYQIDP